MHEQQPIEVGSTEGDHVAYYCVCIFYYIQLINIVLCNEQLLLDQTSFYETNSHHSHCYL